MADSPPGCSSHCQPLPAELKLYQAYIFSTPILFTLVLLLLFYMLCLRRRRSTWAGSHISARFFARGFVSAPSERGLDKSFRDMLPTIIFDGSVAAILEDKQCAICLGDYQMNEKLQRLAVCGHSFHFDCIDKWLSNKTTCPICRTSLLQAAKVVPLDLAATLATTHLANELAEVLPQTSHHQQGHPMEEIQAQERSNIPDVMREDHTRPRDERTGQATDTINLNMQDIEYSARRLRLAESSGVKPDCAYCIEPNGT